MTGNTTDRIKSQIARYRNELDLLNESRDDLSHRLFTAPDDADVQAALDRVEADITTRQKHVARLSSALAVARKADAQAAAEEVRKARHEAAAESLKLADKRVKLAARLDRVSVEMADLLRELADVEGHMMRATHDAGWQDFGRRHTFYIGPFGAVLSRRFVESGVYDRLHMISIDPTARPVHQTCEELARQQRDRTAAFVEARLEKADKESGYVE